MAILSDGGLFQSEPMTKRAKIGSVDIALTTSRGLKNTVDLELSEAQPTGRMDGPLPDYATRTTKLKMSPALAYELGAELQASALSAGYRAEK